MTYTYWWLYFQIFLAAKRWYHLAARAFAPIIEGYSGNLRDLPDLIFLFFSFDVCSYNRDTVDIKAKGVKNYNPSFKNWSISIILVPKRLLLCNKIIQKGSFWVSVSYCKTVWRCKTWLNLVHWKFLI